MKKQIGCVSALVAIAVSYTVWVLLPLSHYDTECASIVEKVTQARKKRQSLASDVEQNGYLDPSFLPFWQASLARPGNLGASTSGQHSQPKSDLDNLLESVLPFCDLAPAQSASGKASARLKTKQSPFADFDKFYPKVREVESKALFVVPDSRPYSFSSPNPNYLALRKLFWGCTGYADYLLKAGRGSEAVAVCQDCIRFSFKLADPNAEPTQLMISLALQSMSQKTLAMILQSHTKLSVDDLDSLGKTLESTQIQRSSLADTLEVNLCMGLNSCEEGRSAKGNSELNIALFWLPGVWAREVRLYKNDCFPMIDQVKKQGWAKPFNLDGSSSSWLMGKHGLVGMLMIPDPSKVEAEIRMARKRQAFLHLYVLLRLYRSKVGHWPASIEILAKEGLQPLEGLEMTKVRYLCEADRISLEFALEPSESATLSPSPHPELKKWDYLNVSPWVFH